MEAQERPITIRLLIYSGRPDPEWTMDSDTIPELGARLQAAVAGEAAEPAPASRLGYRGFLIRDAQALGFSSEFVVYGGVVTEGTGRAAKTRWDADGVEDLLLQEARRRGFGDLLDEAGVKRHP